MYRVFCTIALFLGVTTLVGLQTANADLLTKDSSAFRYKYEMDVDPVGQDLVGTPTGADWGVSSGGATLSTLGDGTTISTIGAPPAYYKSFPSSVPGAVMAASDLTFASGWTVEMRAKTSNATGYDYSIDLEMGDSSSQAVAMQIFLGDSRATWRNANNVTVLGQVNNDDFHTWRIAQLPGANEYRFWRDGVQLFSNITLTGDINEGEPAIYLGNLTSGSVGTTQIDYFRMTSGAFAPMSTPEPGTIVLLSTGLLGLLAYAWRKRK
jgi:hypothetical protein